MKALTLFLPELAVDTLGAPQILQVQALRNAAIEFCERSRAWQEVQCYPLSPGEITYEFQCAAGQIVHELRDGHLVGNGAPELVPVTPVWLNERYPGWQHGRVSGEPAWVTSLDPASFIPVPTPAAAYVAALTVALKPSRDATLVPDLLFSTYYDAILAGARARLMAMPGQPWTNTQLALAYGSSFDSAADSARRRVERGFGRGRHHVKGHYV